MAGDLPSTPGPGAMGFHYGNLMCIEDGGVVDLLQPELLLYERRERELRLWGGGLLPFTNHPATDPPRSCSSLQRPVGVGWHRRPAQPERDLRAVESQGELQ